jgi:carbohydrate kinase (thermoresistant glucokinase family)
MLDALHAIVTVGVSGSGKTTVAEALARRIGWQFCDGDKFHPASNVEKMRSGTPLTDEDRWPWLHAVAAEIARQRAPGEHIVVACSALKRAYRSILVAGNADVRLIYMQGSRDLIKSRLAPRTGHYFPASLLDSQFAALEEPTADEPAIAVDIGQPVEAIVEEIVRRLG